MAHPEGAAPACGGWRKLRAGNGAEARFPGTQKARGVTFLTPSLPKCGCTSALNTNSGRQSEVRKRLENHWSLDRPARVEGGS